MQGTRQGQFAICFGFHLVCFCDDLSRHIRSFFSEALKASRLRKLAAPRRHDALFDFQFWRFWQCSLSSRRACVAEEASLAIRNEALVAAVLRRGGFWFSSLANCHLPFANCSSWAEC